MHQGGLADKAQEAEVGKRHRDILGRRIRDPTPRRLVPKQKIGGALAHVRVFDC